MKALFLVLAVAAPALAGCLSPGPRDRAAAAPRRVLEPGRRFVLVLEGPDRSSPRPWSIVVTVHADADAASSHLVLPVVAGTLGGAAPTLDCPFRPFVPR